MTRTGTVMAITRVLVLVSLAGAAAVTLSCTRSRPAVPTPSGSTTALLPAFVRLGRIQGQPGAVRRIPIEQYVLATILTEVAPTNAPDLTALVRRYEVQAIVTRTYAAANTRRHAADGFDLCATTHCQLVDLGRPATSSWRLQGQEAVARTLGVILVYEDRPALTVFHADCGGHTSSALDVWGGANRPYLRELDDDLPAGTEHQTWRLEVAASELLAALNQDARTAVGASLVAVEVLGRDAGGRNLILRLRGTRTVTVSADEFRMAVTRRFGARSLRSARFTVQRRQASYLFEGRGFGHGVGLCQVGAAARTAHGTSTLAVLAFYYPGTRPAVARLAPTVPTGPYPAGRELPAVF